MTLRRKPVTEQPAILTYRDAIDSCMDFLSGLSTASGQRDIRRAIQTAYREMVSAFDWEYFWVHSRIALVAPTTGTASYTHSTRALTMSVALPSYAADAYLRLGTDICAIESLDSTYGATLHSELNPGEDVAAGTDCSVFRGYYILPTDFVATKGPWTTETWGELVYVTPTEWTALQNSLYTTGTPTHYTIMPVADLHGSMAFYPYPIPDAAGYVDHIYKRRPRQLRISGYATADSQGTVGFSPASTTITNTSSNFTSSMIGSVIRLGDATNTPTGRDGLYPYTDERMIQTVPTAGSCTVDSVPSYTGTVAKYVISDPIDIDEAMFDAFIYCAEKHLSITRNMANKGDMIAIFEDAMLRARGGQEKVTQRRVAGSPQLYQRRLADWPVGSDVD